MAKPDPRTLKYEAAEAVGKGKWKKALECYSALEKCEPGDGSWPQRAGEMCLKLGQRDEAVTAFARSVEVYARTGFTLKAVAICKRVLAEEPGHGAVQSRLAALLASGGPPGGSSARVPVSSKVVPVRPPASARHSAPLGAEPLGAWVVGAHPPMEEGLRASGAVEVPLDEIRLTAMETTRSALSRTPLFSELDEVHLRLLIEECKLVELAAGDILFRVGDLGDTLYVVASGEVAVLAAVPGVSLTKEVARLGEGQFFGEIALLAEQPRGATIQAVEPTTLLAIDRAAISVLLAESKDVLRVLLRFLRDRLLDTLLRTSPLLAPFAEKERSDLAARFRFLEIPSDRIVVGEGDRAEGLFVLVSGRARVESEGVSLAELGPGDLFGEMSLLLRAPAVATIRTLSSCSLLVLPRHDFQEIIMTHPQVLEYASSLAEGRQKANEARRLRLV